MTHSCVWHDPFLCVTWLIPVCDMTHSCVWHDSFLFWCVTWLTFAKCSSNLRLHEPTLSYVWRMHKFDMTHSFAWHDSPLPDAARFEVCVTRLIHMRDSFLCVTNSCVWYDSLMCVTWLTFAPMQLDFKSVWHVSFIRVTHSYKQLIHVCDTTHLCTWHDSHLHKYNWTWSQFNTTHS